MTFKYNKTIMLMYFTLSFLIIIQLLIIPCTSTKAKIVKTPLGKIHGFQKSILHGKKNIDVFLGVPYAKPPIKKLRLKVSLLFNKLKLIVNVNLSVNR